MKKVEMEIECPDCKGTGVYSGMGEGAGIAVVCTRCKGTGAYLYVYHYDDFTGRKVRSDIERVFISGYGYKLGRGVVNFKGVGHSIDMEKEGVSYEDFCNGEMPKHIKKLGCPMMADQSACHKIDGFTGRCNDKNGGWLSVISTCKNHECSEECWKLFEAKSITNQQEK